MTNSSPQFTSGGTVFQRIAALWNQYFASKVDEVSGVSTGQQITNPTITGGTIEGTVISGNIVIKPPLIVDGNATTLPNPAADTVIQAGNADGVASRLELDSFGAPSFFTGKRADGTNVAQTALISGDEIVSLNSWGSNGSGVVGPNAAFRTYAAENWSPTHRGTRVGIATTPIASIAMADVVGFENDGGLTIPPTVSGGSKGPGTINVSGSFYLAGVDFRNVATGITSTGTLTGGSTGAGFVLNFGTSTILGNLTVSHLNGGLSAGSGTFWRGDGTWSPAPTGLISSVFGRTGAVVAQSGDYAVSQLSDVTAPTTWTPADASGASLALTNNGSYYYKVGKMVVVTIDVTYPSTANGSTAAISGLPATADASASANSFTGLAQYVAQSLQMSIDASNHLVFFVISSAAAVTNVNLTTSRLKGSITYFTA